jgi:hypothetical protein
MPPTSTTENASGLLIFKFRGQGHGNIYSLVDTRKLVFFNGFQSNL